jgi:hypothetical protein
MRFALALMFPLLAFGCAEKQAENPGEVLRTEMTNVEPTRPHARAEMFSHANPQSVRAGCDANGNLHLTTPPGSRVSRPEDPTFPSEAVVDLPDPQRGRPIRVTKSLGFIGDNKLNEGPLRHYDQPLTQPSYSYYQRPYVPPTFYPRGY